MRERKVDGSLALGHKGSSMFGGISVMSARPYASSPKNGVIGASAWPDVAPVTISDYLKIAKLACCCSLTTLKSEEPGESIRALRGVRGQKRFNQGVIVAFVGSGLNLVGPRTESGKNQRLFLLGGQCQL